MNQNKILITTFLILFLTFASAEISIQDINILSPQPLIAKTDAQFQAIIFNDTNETGNVTLKMISQTIELDSKTIDINGIGTFTKTLNWNHNQIETIKGEHSVLFELSGIGVSDSNSENNSKTKTITFYNGNDLQVSNIQITTSSPTPEQTITINASIKQNGDLSINTPFNSCYYYDNTEKECQTINSMNAGETKTLVFYFTVPADFIGNHELKIKTDTSNVIVETDENNNSGAITLTSVPMPNLSVDSSDISISSAVAGEPITFQIRIRNTGSLPANNALVKVWHTSEQPQYLLHSQTIPSIVANSEQTINFVYTPAIEGFDLILVRLDPQNQISESSELDNYAESAFTVTVQDSNVISPTSFPIFFEISSDCIALLANGDRLVSRGVVEDGNEFKLSFDLIDGLGKTLLTENAGTGFQKVLPGRTLRLISVSKYSANLLMIFQTQNSVIYTTCEKNISDAITEAEAFKESFRACQATLSETTTKYNTELAVKDSLQSQLSISNEGLSLCNNEKSTLSTNLSLKEDSCQEKISLMMANQDTQCKELQQNEKDKTELEKTRADKAEGERDFWIILFFIFPFSAGALMIYVKTRKSD